MAHEEKFIAAGVITVALGIAIIVAYYVEAAKLNGIPLKHYPKYSRETQMDWIAEIAESYGCTPERFMEKLVDTVFNCTNSDAFKLDHLYHDIQKNLSFPTGKIPNSAQSAGLWMLMMTGPFIVALVATCGASFGISLGLMFAGAALARCFRSLSRSTTSSVMASLDGHQRLDEEEGQELEVISTTATTTTTSNSNHTTDQADRDVEEGRGEQVIAKSSHEEEEEVKETTEATGEKPVPLSEQIDEDSPSSSRSGPGGKK